MDWSRVADAPYDFRDRVTVDALLDAIVHDATARDDAGSALASVVKALEDEPVDGWRGWIECRLPQLVFALAEPEGALAGPIISVMRRVRPRTATLERIIERVQVTPTGQRRLLLQALGLCDEWLPQIEDVVAAELDGANAVVAAEVIYGLSWRPDWIRNEATLDGLARLARSGDVFARDYSVAALCMLVDVRDRARELLEELIASGAPELRQSIDKRLGYRESAVRTALRMRMGQP